MRHVDAGPYQEVDLVTLHDQFYDLVCRPLAELDAVLVTLDQLIDLLQGEDALCHQVNSLHEALGRKVRIFEDQFVNYLAVELTRNNVSRCAAADYHLPVIGGDPGGQLPVLLLVVGRTGTDQQFARLPEIEYGTRDVILGFVVIILIGHCHYLACKGGG